MEFYHSIINYYDQIFPFNKKQVDFVYSQLGGDIKQRKIVDVGCGTGTLSMALKNIGADVVGIDFDENMVSKAREKFESEQSVFMQGDMRYLDTLVQEANIDAVLCFGNTLVHLANEEDVQKFINAAYSKLGLGGKLLLQIINYDRIIDHNIQGLSTIKTEDCEFVRKYRQREGDNYIDFVTRLDLKNGKSITNSIPLLPIRKKRLHELLEASGFIDIRFYGGFDMSELTSTSVPLVVAALKK